MKYVTTCFLIFIIFHCCSQDFTMENRLVVEQQSKILTYNILCGGVTAGIGSVINKPKQESITKAFLRGASRGMIGGAVTFTGKKLTFLIPKHSKEIGGNHLPTLGYNHSLTNQNQRKEYSSNSLIYGWLSKLVHSTGVSIITNASNHDALMENWSTELGFVRFNYDFKNNKASGRILISRIYGFIRSEKLGNINYSKSLAIGQFYFDADISHSSEHGYDGMCRYCSISITQGSSPNYIAHELIHSLQQSELITLSTWTKKPQEKLSKTKLGLITRAIYLEPYFIDQTYRGLISKFSNNTYSRKINELESFSLSTNKYVSKF